MRVYRWSYSTLIGRLLDLLLPPRQTDRTVRELTLEELRGIACRKERGDTLFFLPYHDPRITALIWELKYRNNPRALSLCAHIVEEELSGIAEEELAAPLLIPLPMWEERKKARGFNPTEELCTLLFRNNKESAAYEPGALRRTRPTSSQQTLPRKERLTNMRGAMHARPSCVHGRTCVVIDDVVTTGATLAEARRALLQAGAHKVILIALAG